MRLTFDRKINPGIDNADSDTFATILPIVSVIRIKSDVHG